MPVAQKKVIESISLLHPYQLLCEEEAGVDEVGRGCGAGPVVAAAVILPAGASLPLLRDSKKILPELRYQLRDMIHHIAIDYAIGVATVEEIDEINILEATYLAMHRALGQLKSSPKLLLIDGNRFKNKTSIPHETIIKGDDKILSIAAASIMAKTWRDDHMKELHLQHPEYDWKQNKGYLTSTHRKACFSHGLTPHHRKSFKGMIFEENLVDGK